MKALIFDFDGTILDTETPELRGWQAFYREHGQELPLERWRAAVGTWDAFDPWAALPLSAREREATLREGILREIGESDVRPGVRALLDEARARGLRLAVASSSDGDWVHRWLRAHGLHGHFEAFATREQVARVKPDPELYRLALRQLGLPAQDCLAVEDSHNGATAALAAGLGVVVVPNEVTAGQPLPPQAARLPDFSGGLGALLRAGGVAR